MAGRNGNKPCPESFLNVYSIVMRGMTEGSGPRHIRRLAVYVSYMTDERLALSLSIPLRNAHYTRGSLCVSAV